MTDYTTAELSDADRAMLDYAIKLTRTPAEVSSGDIDGLRAVGFDDESVHHIVQVTALFNYYNRLVDGLGGDDEAEWTSPPSS
jgi:uncharacterized peroxidase-related enzyme